MGTSVLIVDDDASFQAAATQLLALRGFDVVGYASDVARALEVAARIRPDAVLLDVHLGEGDGQTIVSGLVALGARVLLTSSDPDALSTEMARRSGAAGFLPKADLVRAPLARYLCP
jgi:DNA-binding NarL/FixJ family response regulator